MKGILHTDGGARGNPGPSGFGAVLFDENYKLLDIDAGYSAHSTNNFAEYSALLIGLNLAVKKGITELTCFMDSELAVRQLNGEYKIKNDDIKEFHKKIEPLRKIFKKVLFVYTPRENNKIADKLVNLVLDLKHE